MRRLRHSAAPERCVFKLGDSLFKFTKYIIKKIEEENAIKSYINEDKVNTKKDKSKLYNNKVLDKIFSFIHLNEIKDLFNNISEEYIFEIGNTILKLMIDKTEVDSTYVTSTYNSKELMVTIDSEYLKKLNVSSIDVTQLPRLTIPNKPFEDGKYLPYQLPEISHIYNTFDTIVKKIFNLKFNVENQDVLNESVCYLNNTAFNINNYMLNFYFILDEWSNDKSLIFKGGIDIKKIIIMIVMKIK